MPFVDVAESVGGGAVVEVAVRRCRGRCRVGVAGVEEVVVESQAQGGAELVMGIVVSK